MKDVKWFDKGFYHHPQASGFVSLKQYMIVENGGKKCLMLRFFNELQVAVSNMEFKLKELDTHGGTLKTVNIKLDSMSLAPGGSYAMPSGIVISEKCADFEVTVISATSNGYKYVLKHGVPTPTYDLRRPQQKHAPRESTRSTTKKIETKGRILATLLSFSIIAVTVFMMIYFSTRNFSNFSSMQQIENLISDAYH